MNERPSSEQVVERLEAKLKSLQEIEAGILHSLAECRAEIRECELVLGRQPSVRPRPKASRASHGHRMRISRLVSILELRGPTAFPPLYDELVDLLGPISAATKETVKRHLLSRPDLFVRIPGRRVWALKTQLSPEECIEYERHRTTGIDRSAKAAHPSPAPEPER